VRSVSRWELKKRKKTHGVRGKKSARRLRYVPSHRAEDALSVARVCALSVGASVSRAVRAHSEARTHVARQRVGLAPARLEAGRCPRAMRDGARSMTRGARRAGYSRYRVRRFLGRVRVEDSDLMGRARMKRRPRTSALRAPREEEAAMLYPGSMPLSLSSLLSPLSLLWSSSSFS
jgi:hypothetical protein